MKIKTKSRGGAFTNYDLEQKRLKNQTLIRQAENLKQQNIEKEKLAIERKKEYIKKTINYIINKYFASEKDKKIKPYPLTNIKMYYYTIRGNMYWLNLYEYYMFKLAEKTKKSNKVIHYKQTEYHDMKIGDTKQTGTIYFDNFFIIKNGYKNGVLSDNQPKYIIQKMNDCKPLQKGKWLTYLNSL